MSPEKFSARKSRKKDPVVVEKAEAEELPPGWTKDVKIRKNSSKIKKDPYYKDPATGYTFRSMKEVQRYLKTGHVGKRVIKPKDDSCVDMETEDENAQAGGDECKLPETGTNDDQMGVQESSSLTEMKNDEKIVQSTVNVNIADGSEEKEGKDIAGLTDVDLLEVKEKEKKSESEEQVNLSTPLNENSRRKRSLENESEGHKKRSKSSEQSTSTLPRRASKRLAGIDADTPPLPPPPEPKTRSQTAAIRTGEAKTSTPATTKRTREAKTSTLTSTKCTRGAKTSTPSNLATPKERDAAVHEATSREKQADPIALTEVEKDIKLEDKQETKDNKPDEKQNLSTTEESCEKVKKEDLLGDEKQESPIVSPPVAPSAPEEHENEVKIDNLAKETQASPTVLPVTSLPTPEKLNPSVEPDNNPGEKQVETDDKARDKQVPADVTPQTADVKPESPVNFSLTDLWTDPCIEFAVKTLTGDIPIPTEEENKPDKILPPPPVFPLGEIWTDPCIEFAVKTLTGAIPVDPDICVQDYLQHQAGTSSSETRCESSFSLPDVGFCQTEVLSKHLENSLDLKAPTLDCHGNGSLEKPGNKVASSEQKCSRTRFFG